MSAVLTPWHSLQVVEAHSRSVLSVDWCPAAHTAVATAGSDNAIRIWRAASALGGEGSALALDVEVATAHDGDVNCVAWRPGDATALASAGDDGLVKIWRFAA